MTLSEFVVTRVLPDSQLRKEKDDPMTQAKAKSQAVEQIASKALSLSRSKGHGSLVSKDAINATFRINGDCLQNVQLRDA